MENNEYLDEFEKKVGQALYALLHERKKIDDRMPDMPDLDDRWEGIAQDYLTDGVREFPAYPMVSIGWMMYVGMAMARLWDESIDDFKATDYAALRDKRGYDCMDEAIREEVLHLEGDDFKAMETLVGSCADTALNMLRKERIEPGTPQAFHAYVRVLHQMYVMGAATELLRMGYRMQKM